MSHGKSIVGDNVIFGSGSKLMRGFNVGKNAKVGANCVVIENIPENATVVLTKPKIIIK